MFVGRDRELGELVGALERARAAGGSLFLISGEPGIGKTRLATEAADAARTRGVAVAWGRCWEAGGAPALWPWKEAFESFGVPFPDAESIAASDPEAARFELFRKVTAALAHASSERPLLVVLEDLHAADRSTLVLLEFVAGQLRSMPVHVIGTYRDVEARQRADSADAIARAGRAGHVLQLGRLDVSDVTVLVRRDIANADERLVAALYDTTQGNPLFIREVVRDIRAHGVRSHLPLGVREIIRQRLALFSPDARAVLEVCAVLGVELSGSDVARVIPGAAAVLEDATKGGVLVVHGNRLRFSHALYREALYFDLPIERRSELHRSAAQALHTAGAPLAERAHHLLEAGPNVVNEAVDVAVRAAEHATRTFAFEDALAILERARGAVPSDAPALRGRVLIALGETKLRSGDAGGHALCMEAAEIARSLGDAILLAKAGLAYGSVLLMGGVDPVLVRILEEALAGLPEGDSSLRASLMARLAGARQPSPPAERARDVNLGLAAIAMARRVAAPRELLGVLNAAAGLLYGKVDPAERLPIAREAEALAEELGDTTRLLQARVRLANDLLELGDFAEYARLASNYETLATRIGSAAAPWRVPLMRSMIAIAKDDFAESERHQEEARRLDDGTPRARRALAFHRVGFLRAAERHAELRAAIPELRSLWLAMPYGAALTDARVVGLLARIGADDGLRALLAQCSDEILGEEINAIHLADALWLAADVAFARRLEPVLAPFHGRWAFYWFDCEIVDAPVTRLQSHLTAILGRWEESERLFERALADLVAAGRRSLVARLQFERGDLLLRLGRDGADLVANGRRKAEEAGLQELVALIDRRHRTVTPSTPSRHSPFRMTLEGEYYAIASARGALRFKASRGFHYLAMLVERPSVDLHVLELMGATDADRGDAGEVVDATALRAYRARLEALRDAADNAEELGDGERVASVRAEMEAIAAEIGRTTKKRSGSGGGRPRRAESVADRARSAVQRRIKDALDRIAEQDPALGAWLRRTVKTGNYCSFRPEP